MIAQRANTEPGEPMTVIMALFVLWQGRMIVGLVTFFCIALAVIVLLFSPRRYESSANLLLRPMAFMNVKEEIGGLTPLVLDVNDYAVLLRSDAVLSAVGKKVREMGVERRPMGVEELKRATEIASLRSTLKLSTTRVEQTAYGTKYSPVITLTAQSKSAELARDLVTTWAKVAEEKAAEYYKYDKSGLEQFVKEQFDSVNTDLVAILKAKRTLEKKWDEELALNRVAAKSDIVSSMENDLAHITIKLGGYGKEIIELQSLLDREIKTVTLWHSPPIEALFLSKDLMPEGSLSNTEGKAMVQGYRRQEINPDYFHLSKELLSRRAAFTNLAEQEHVTIEIISTTRKALEDLIDENAQYSMESRLLDLRFEVSTTTYKLLATKLEQAKIGASEQSNLSDLKIVSRAILSERPTSRNANAILASAGFLGFVSSCIAVLIRSRIYAEIETASDKHG